jgi:pectinesterase
MNKGIILAVILSSVSHASILAQGDGTLQGDLAPEIDLVVSGDGTGDYTSIQEAIDAVPDNAMERTVVFVKKGTYREKVLVPSSKRNLTLVGEDADSTVLVWDDYATRIVDGDTLNTFTSQTIRVDADDFRAMNMTFENDARPGGTGTGQNVALSIYGARAVLLHCRLIAWQDTYYTGSNDRHYLKDCYIEGAVDYIFGHTTTLFDSCQIQTVRDGGYITAASTLENYQFGYVFLYCRLTAPPGTSGVYLGRPWKTYARTVFYECVELENISLAGWHVWGGRENTCYYAEYNCSGPGSDTTSRVDWSHQLTDNEADAYTMEQIFSAGSSTAFTQDWNPQVEQDPVWTAVKEHTVMFLDSINTDARIASLLVDGEPVPDWDPSVYEFPLEIGSDPQEMPVLSATAVNPLSEVTISYPELLPGFAEITVLANDGGTYSNYRIYFSVDSSYTDTSLDSIRIAGEILEGFSPDVYEYDVVLPADVSKYWGISGYAHVNGAWVVTSKPASLPGTATIDITAVDGISTSTYFLNITLDTGVKQVTEESPMVEVVGPVRESLHLRIRTNEPSQLLVKVLQLNGAVILEQSLPPLIPGMNDLFFPAPESRGLYIYHVTGAGWRRSGLFGF